MAEELGFIKGCHLRSFRQAPRVSSCRSYYRFFTFYVFAPHQVSVRMTTLRLGQNRIDDAYHDENGACPCTMTGCCLNFSFQGAQASEWSLPDKRDNIGRRLTTSMPKKSPETTREKSKLLADAGIVRNKLKIAAAVKMQAFLAVQKEFEISMLTSGASSKAADS